MSKKKEILEQAKKDLTKKKEASKSLKTEIVKDAMLNTKKEQELRRVMQEASGLSARVNLLEQRIDNIITAHESCKSLKGL